MLALRHACAEWSGDPADKDLGAASYLFKQLGEAEKRFHAQARARMSVAGLLQMQPFTLGDGDGAAGAPAAHTGGKKRRARRRGSVEAMLGVGGGTIPWETCFFQIDCCEL
jgi:hypothetical protein